MEKKKAFICFISFLLSLALYGCGNESKKIILNKENEVNIVHGTYYLNDDVSDEASCIVVDEKDMITYVNIDYQGIVDKFKEGYPEVVFMDNADERMAEPYTYYFTSRKGEIGVNLFENCVLGIVMNYNPEDGIITFMHEDYYLENEYND